MQVCLSVVIWTSWFLTEEHRADPAARQARPPPAVGRREGALRARGCTARSPRAFPAAAGEGRCSLQATQPAEPSAGLPVLEKCKEQKVQRKGSEPRVHVSASSVVRSGAGLSSHCTSVK